MKIRIKLFLYTMIFLTSVFVILYFISSRISRDTIIENINSHINTAVKFKVNNIETLLQNYKNVTQLLAADVYVIQYFDTSIDHEMRENNLKTRISNTIKIDDQINRIRLLDKNGIVIASSHEEIGMDRSDRQIFLEGKKGIYIRELHFSEFTGQYVISVAVPININGEIYGVLIINFSPLEKLFPILADRTGLINSTNIFLLNKDFYLISPTRYGDKIMGTKFLPQQITLYHAEEHLENEIPSFELQSQTPYKNYRGKKVMGVHCYISLMKNFLILEVNEKDVIRPLIKYRNYLLFLFGIFLLLFLVVSYFVAVLLTKPIEILQKGTLEIIKGNLDYKFGTKRKDEIGQLSRACDNMTQNLKMSKEKLEKHSKNLSEKVKERTIELNKKILESKQQKQAILNVAADLEKINIDLHKEIENRIMAEEQVKRDLKEKNVLLQEVHHRVKNNMQIVSSMLKLQAASITDEKALELFQNSRDRVKTMALIHDSLYRSKDLAHIDFADYVRKLTTQIFISYGANSDLIKLKLNVKNILLDINTAIPCGLIINELVSNSLKYAFPEGRKGEISVDFTYKNKFNNLCVKDNGIGISGEINLKNPPTLGLLLVNSLTKQLDGTLKIEKIKGTSFKITFKKIELKTYRKVEE